MGQPLGVILLSTAETELWPCAYASSQGEGERAKSRMSHVPASKASTTAITLLLFHWEPGLVMATPDLKAGGQCRGSAGLMCPLAGQLCAQLLSYLLEDGKDGFGWTAGCLCLLDSVSSSIKWLE